MEKIFNKRTLLTLLFSVLISIPVVNATVKVEACGKTEYTVDIAYFVDEDCDVECAIDAYDEWIGEIIDRLCN